MSFDLLIDREPGGGFRVQLSHEGATTSVHYRALVGADGPASRVRRTFFPDRPARGCSGNGL